MSKSIRYTKGDKSQFLSPLKGGSTLATSIMANESKLFPKKDENGKIEWSRVDNWLIPASIVFIILVIILLRLPHQSPKVDILSGGEVWVNSTEGTLIFVASDNSGGSLICDIELNGGIVKTVNASSGVQQEEPLTLSLGTNSIRVKATDQVGLYSWSNVFTVHVDDESPTVVIIDFLGSQ